MSFKKSNGWKEISRKKCAGLYFHMKNHREACLKCRYFKKCENESGGIMK